MTHKEHADTRRILVIATGHKGSRAPGRDNTGLWFADLAEFVDELGDDDYVIDIASPNGGAIPIDPASLAADMMPASSRSYYDDPAFMLRLHQSLALSNINWRDYEAVYFPGGQGALWDLASDARVGTLVCDAWQDGRVIASVGDGLAALLNARLPDGGYLLAGKTIAAPYEHLHGAQSGHQPHHLHDEAAARGAKFDSGGDPAIGPMAVDGRLVTGQGAPSARKVAQAVYAQIKPHHHD